MAAHIGFFEESPDVFSMTRLVVFLLTMGAEAIVSAIVYVAVKHPDAGVIAALGTVLVALCGGIWSALREKRKGDEAPAPPSPDPIG